MLFKRWHCRDCKLIKLLLCAKQQIQEIEEQNDQDGPKLNDSLTPDQTIMSEQSKPSQAPCVIPLQNISPQVRLSIFFWYRTN